MTMMARDSFADLMGRLRQGEQDAAARLFDGYARRLIGLAYRHLDSRLRQKVGPEDVMQSVLKSFFARQRAGQFELADWDGLWALLVRITLHKCGHQVEYYRAACRDVTREQAALGSDESVHAFQALAAEPSPDEAAHLAELTEEVMKSLGSDRERQIFALSLEGHTPVEISEQVGRTDRTVQRTLARIRSKLERMREAE
jgi:RNA polymerase sigma-70 factor, ECF subfamily